ncbi:EAL domain-containing protein [Dokdonella soli]|uniref:EAL domain-containing protein n=1 Tax=Dokdonella soli TaxID=529810 RepID=A0ABN1IKW2_9GAMM
MIACIVCSASAQGEAVRRDFFFQTIGTDHGLAQNSVIAFLQDRAGFIWIGTAGGLQQYDGYGFNTYEHSGDDPDSPPAGPVTALAEDGDGNIWIGSSTLGLIRHTPSTGVFQHMGTTEPGTDASWSTVRALRFDPRQGLWIASDAGIALVDTTNGRTKRRLPIVQEDNGALHVRKLDLTDDGTLWIASSAGLLRLVPGTDALERVATDRIDDPQALLLDHARRLHVATANGVYRIMPDGSAEQAWPAQGHYPVTAMVEDPRGRLWFAVPNEGLAVFDAAGNQTQWLKPDNGLAGSPPDATVTSLDIDRSGLLWVGTLERGIAKVDPNGTLFRYVADREPGPASTAANYIRALFEDASGGLWLGADGDGPKRYDRAANRFDHYTDLIANGLKDTARDPRVTVSAFADAGGGRLWVGTNHGVALLDPVHRQASFLPTDAKGAHGLPDVDVRSLLSARDGTLWIGSARGGLVQHSPGKRTWTLFRRDASETAIGGLADDRIVVLHEDREGRIWVGTMTGLNLIDPVQRSVRVFRNDPADAHSLSANLVRAFQETEDGQLWIGTQSGLDRLDVLDAEHARFTRWLPRDGLPSGTVYAIADDRMGRLWLSTNRGIASFDRTSSTFRTFTLADGLQGMEFNGSACAMLRDGQLAFGGVNGLNLFSPQAIVGSRYAAPVVFTNVRIGNRDAHVLHEGSQLQMEAADRIVRFEFAALDFTAPDRNQFAYQLDGFDDHWIEAGARHEATYTNLDPGRYTFKVRGSNHDGYWNDRIATIALHVTPPWWDSPAAKVAYVLIAAAALLLAWRAHRRRRSEERAYHRDLKEREDRLRLALWGSGDDFWDWSIARNEVVVTGTGDLFKGVQRRPARLPYAWLREHLHVDDLPAVERRLENHINRTTDTFESEHRLRRRDGRWTWSLARGKIVERDEDGQPLRMCGTARDVTEERAAEQDRRVAQEVIRSMAEAVAVSDLDYHFLTVNPAFTRITGWRQEEIAGQPTALLNCSQHPAEHYVAIRDKLARSGHWRGELWQRRKDGDEFLSWSEISEVRDANGVRTHYVSVISDITDRKRTEQELRYLANYDALTGLPNRTLLSERIGHAIVRARRGAHKIAVLFLDLDRFKHVNDSMGHAAGDRMLKAAGNRLRQVVREGDSVARLGGDEFTIVLEDIGSAEAERVAEKVIAAFEEPLELDNGQEVVISPSIGISLYPDHGQVPTDLLKFADTAMYQAKEHGRKTWMVYTEAMDAAARLRATTVAALRKALERNELSLVYQPKLSLLDERITGVEALLRWRSGDLGNVSPGVFIPIAEETGLIVEIGDWVVAQACAQLARWREAGIHDITMSVNVSVAQLRRGDLIRRLCDVLAEHDIAPNQLELELTESMVMANAEQSITTLRRLKAIGVTLAIDDFGTGYSSLSYLKRLPIDTLKIDKEFVGDITTDPDDEAITATVITMAHSLGLNVVAEGVERAEQVEYLREQDCDEIQGHWLAFPLPPDQCLAFLRERAQRRRVALGEPHP